MCFSKMRDNRPGFGSSIPVSEDCLVEGRGLATPLTRGIIFINIDAVIPPR